VLVSSIMAGGGLLDVWAARDLFGAHSSLNAVRLFQVLFCGGLVVQTFRLNYDQLEYRRLALGGGSPAHVMKRRGAGGQALWPLLGHETWPVFGWFDLRLSRKTFLYFFDALRLSLALATVGFYPRPMLACACVFYFGSFSQLVGLSYVRRKSNLFPFIFATLAAAPSVDAGWRAPVPLWPLYLVLVALCMQYFNAGLTKLRVSGWGWVTSEALQAHTLEECLFKPNPLGMWFSSQTTLCKLLAAFALFFELAYPLALVFPTAALLFGAMGAAFHYGVFKTMKVDFIRYFSPIYFVFAALLADKLGAGAWL
jgi:hypothetical protein